MTLIDKVLFKSLRIKPSFSQSGEDRILRHLFNYYKKNRISYLDIGTNHPVMENNTYLFYRDGSRGVCVEPNPELHKKIKSVRPGDTSLNVGVSTGEEGEADFYSMSVHTLSTFSKDDAEELDRTSEFKIREVIRIPLRNINSIIKQYFNGKVDLVSIDVEGWNEEIVESFDFSQSRPFCFCIETLSFEVNRKPEKLARIFDVMKRNDYSVYGDTFLNTIFVDNKI